MSKLIIKNLHVVTADKEILKGIDLELNTGEIHALIGPNGHGKSTLLFALMGHPKYQITEGNIILDGEDITNLSVDERAKKGLFLGMQYPVEIPGVNNSDFLKAAINAKEKEPISLFKFIKKVETATKEVGLPLDMIHRYLNDGFSGGEKKRNEMVQMKVLEPKFAFLDEIDSGLDVDAIKVIADVINNMRGDKFGALIISHYARMYQLVPPTKVHIIIDGKIVKSGGVELVEKVDTQGYDFLKEFGIEIQKNDKSTRPTLSIGSCATKEIINKNGNN